MTISTVRAENVARIVRITTAVAESAGASEGQVVILQGAVGMGRSTIVEHAAAAARRLGVTVLHARCSPVEQQLPFGMVAQLLDGHDDPPDDPADDDGVALATLEDRVRAALEFDQVDDPDVTVVGRGVHAVAAWITRLCRTTPVLLVIDDVHYADTWSMQCLRHLVRRTRAARCVLLVTSSIGVTPEDRDFLHELKRDRNCVELGLEGLTQAEAASILATGPSSTDPAVVDAAVDRTGGNPSLLKAYAADAADAADAAADPTTGGSTAEHFVEAVGWLLRRLDPEAGRLATAVAMLGGSADQALVEDVLELPPGGDDLPVRALSSAGILAPPPGVSFRHPALADGLTRAADTDQIRALSTRAAQVLHDRGARTDDIARMVMLTGEITESWMPGLLEEAAASARERADLDLAARCLDHVYRNTDDRRRRTVVKAKLAETIWHHNPVSSLRHLRELADEVDGGFLGVRESMAVVRGLLWQGRAEDAARVFARLTSAPGVDHVTAAEMYIARLWMCATHPPVVAMVRTRGGAELRRPGGRPVTLDTRLCAATVLVNVLTGGGEAADVQAAEEVLQRATFADKSPAGIEAAVLALLSLLYADRPDLSARWCDRMLTESAVGGSPAWHAQLAGTRAEIALRHGDLPTAIELGEQAMAGLPTGAWGVAVGIPLGTLMQAYTAAGRHDDAAALAARSVPDGMFQSRYGLHYLYSRGQHHLANRRHYAALADFMACGELMAAWGMDVPALVPWRTGAAAAWLELGDPAQARRLVSEQIARSGPRRTRSRGIALRYLARVVDVQRRPMLLAEALDILEQSGDRLQRAEAMWDLSRCMQDSGDQRARATARRAWLAAQQCQAKELGDRICPGGVERETAAVKGSTPETALATLSEAERRVATYAAEGYPNREIAKLLFITVSTVEQHLTKIYRKLDVQHRRDLAAVVYVSV